MSGATIPFRNRDSLHRGVLAELIRFARFDALVARRLLRATADDYETSVHDITIRANEAALDALAFAHALIADHDPASVMDHWSILEEAARAEQSEEAALTAELQDVMSRNGATVSRAAALS